MFPFSVLKKGYEVIDDLKEKVLDDFIICGFMDVLDENTTVDELQKKGIKVAITAGSKYAYRYGLPECPENVKDVIADKVVHKLGVLNRKIHAEAIKKSKGYTERHSHE